MLVLLGLRTEFICYCFEISWQLDIQTLRNFYITCDSFYGLRSKRLHFIKLTIQRNERVGAELQYNYSYSDIKNLSQTAVICNWKQRLTPIVIGKHFCSQRVAVYSVVFFFVPWRDSPHWAMASSFLRFLDHTQRRTTVGRTPFDEWSARRRDLYLTTHNTHNRHPCPRWDSNSRSQQGSGRRPWDRHTALYR